MQRKFLLHFIFLFSLFFTGNVFAAYYKLSDYSIVQKFITDMVYKYNFDKSYLTKTLNSVTIRTDAIEKTTHPYEEKPWNVYKKHFLTQVKIENGVEYWCEHKKALDYAEKTFGVPPEIIVAIIGIESNYGVAKFNYSVLDTLATLAFARQNKTTFFLNELSEYFLLTRELNLDPKSIKGSYAGAIGIPQFMPSSYRRFGMSYQKQKFVNLMTNDDDAIISIANFLHYFGWQKNADVAIPAIIRSKNYNYEKLLNNSLKPQFTLDTLAKYHVYPAKKIPKNNTANLFQFTNQNDTCEYWLGLQNFYVLSRYNPHKQYVLAVYLLAQRIKQAAN